MRNGDYWSLRFLGFLVYIGIKVRNIIFGQTLDF